MLEITLPWRFAPIKFPITEWLPEYKWKEWAANDITAGFTVFIFLIPQGMAYGLLAGMPPIYGLYSAIVPLYIYAILGTSKQLSLGPMAITSLLLNVSVKSYGYEEQSPEYIKLVMNLSLVVGLCILLIGMLKLGSLVNFISASVLTGFLTASALVIFLNQIKYIFGLGVPRFDYTYQTIVYILSHLGESNANASALGLATFAVLLAVREWKKRNKPTAENLKSTRYRVLDLLAKLSNLLCIIFGSMIAYFITEGGTFIDIVGDVPSGLKAPGFDGVGFTEGIGLIPGALAVAFVAFAGNWAVAKKYAAEHNYDVDATQELIAEGLAVTVGAFFNSFAGSGGLSRSAVNAESGAITQLATIVVASLILLSVQFLTALFYYIPMCVLGAVIMVSVISMLNFQAMQKAYHTHPDDCLVMVLTSLATFFIGVSEGLFIGIGLSLAIIIYNTAFPSISHLGKLCDQDGGHYQSIDRFENAKQHPGVAIVRMDATLFFANSAYFKEVAMRAANGEFHSSREVVTHLIVDASCWIDIDLPATQAITDLWKDLDKKHVDLSIVGAKAVVRDRLRDCDFPDERVRRYHYFTIQAAMEDIDHSDALGEILPERHRGTTLKKPKVSLFDWMRCGRSATVLPICEDSDKQDSAPRERSGTGAASVRSDGHVVHDQTTPAGSRQQTGDSHVVHDHIATLPRVNEHNEQLLPITAATSVEQNTEINNNHN